MRSIGAAVVTARRRRATLAAIAAVAVSSVLAAPATSTASSDAPRPADRAPAGPVSTAAPTVVDAQLTAALGGSATGAPAVITAHRRSDLPAIERLGISGRRLGVLPMLLADRITTAQLEALEASGLARSVYANRRYPVTMEDSAWIVGARYAWGPSAPLRFGENGDGTRGYTGAAVDIAVIDTGIDGRHEDADNLVEFCDTTGAVTGSGDEVVCAGGNGVADSAEARAAAFDDEGHGSHVSGTVAGSGDATGGIAENHSTIGIAPRAQLHVYSANVGPALANFQILAAYDHMIDRKLNGGSRVVATSNSFGGGDGANYSPDDPQNVAIKAAYDAGIVSVYAAGNSGPEHNTLSDSCINPYVVCVGATTKPGSVVQFSSRGRPSEPADTNRNGVVGDNGDNGTPGDTSDDIAPDVAPDNHDRRLGQRLGIGVYRPTLVAPGVNINSISANAAGCREGAGTDTGCYEPLNGTSMATPHVSGAVAVIVDAWRATHGGRTPSPARIIDLLERSAGVQKLPGYESEEQGAGLLNVFGAVRHIRGELDLPRANLGTPSPVYADGMFPGAAGTKQTFSGCTGPLSFTVGDPNPIDEGADVPPIETIGFEQHRITVPQAAERLRVTVDWSEQHPGSNLYVRLWRPGVDPDDEFSTEFAERAFPDQEAIGLSDTNVLLEGRRFLDVRAPEPGTWKLRVYHRAGGAALPCTAPGSPVSVGYNYAVTTELPISARTPQVTITRPQPGTTHTGRVVDVRGTASYPQRWNGVTNYEVPGTGIAPGGGGGDPRLELHLQGNVEEGCTGDGSTDLSNTGCNGGDGPALRTNATLSAAEAASWDVPNPILTVDTERNEFTPNWIWDISSERTLRGPMTVEWWGSCATCGPTLGSADWVLRLYADGEKAFEQRVTATPDAPNTPTLLTANVDLPTIRARDRVVLHIEPVYIDSQNAASIHYDSADPCPGATATAPCGSTVQMPVVDPSDPRPEQVDNLRVTDPESGGALRIAWDPSDGASTYQVHRSTNPAFVPGSATLLTTTPGTTCRSPSVPSWPSASDGGARCFTDTTVTDLTSYYYRVVALGSGTAAQARGALVAADPSLLASGTSSTFDRQVQVKGDRLYGPGMWSFARLRAPDGTSWIHPFDTLERPAGTAGDPHELDVAARSFTQGIGSAKARRTVRTIGPAPPGPFDPVVVLTKSGPATADPGETISYGLEFENLGPFDVSRAVVTDALPGSLVFVSATGGGVFDPARRAVRWDLGTVSVGTSGRLELRARVRGDAEAGRTMVNTAKLKAPLTVATPAAAITTIT